MFLRIEDVYWKLQEEGPFEYRGQPYIPRRGEGEKDTGALRVAGVLLPVIAALITFLGAGAFLHVDAANEQEEAGKENGAYD